MSTKSLLFGALALIQSTALFGGGMNQEAEIQQTGVGFSIEVGPSGGPYYYGPYDDPYGPCYGPGGVYLGPGCPRYYYGPSYYYNDRGRRHHRDGGRRHGGGRHHGGRRGRR